MNGLDTWARMDKAKPLVSSSAAPEEPAPAKPLEKTLDEQSYNYRMTRAELGSCQCPLQADRTVLTWERVAEGYNTRDTAVDPSEEFPTRSARLIYEATRTLRE